MKISPVSNYNNQKQKQNQTPNFKGLIRLTKSITVPWRAIEQIEEAEGQYFTVTARIIGEAKKFVYEKVSRNELTTRIAEAELPGVQKDISPWHTPPSA